MKAPDAVGEVVKTTKPARTHRPQPPAQNKPAAPANAPATPASATAACTACGRPMPGPSFPSAVTVDRAAVAEDVAAGKHHKPPPDGFGSAPAIAGYK